MNKLLQFKPREATKQLSNEEIARAAALRSQVEEWKYLTLRLPFSVLNDYEKDTIIYKVEDNLEARDIRDGARNA